LDSGLIVADACHWEVFVSKEASGAMCQTRHHKAFWVVEDLGQGSRLQLAVKNKP